MYGGAGVAGSNGTGVTPTGGYQSKFNATTFGSTLLKSMT